MKHLQASGHSDKTSPKISNNFDSFGSVENENIYYNISQKDKAKAEITVNETNFYPDDMHITVYYQPAGSKHSDTGANWNTYYYSSDWKDDGNGKHTLIIPFTEDGVYKITMSPVDRAGNAGDFSKGANSKYPSETAIFEADYTAPIIVSRDNKSVKSDDIKFYDLYDFERRNDAHLRLFLKIQILIILSVTDRSIRLFTQMAEKLVK